MVADRRVLCRGRGWLCAQSSAGERALGPLDFFADFTVAGGHAGLFLGDGGECRDMFILD